MFVCKSQEIMRKGGNYIMFLNLLTNVADTWQQKIVNAVDTILVPILIIGCSVGMIWAIVVGIKMMKADDKNAREENKAKLINIAISIVAVAVLIGLFYAIKSWLSDSNITGSDFDIFNETKDETTKTLIGGQLKNTLSLVGQCARMLVFKC